MQTETVFHQSKVKTCNVICHSSDLTLTTCQRASLADYFTFHFIVTKLSDESGDNHAIINIIKETHFHNQL